MGVPMASQLAQVCDVRLAYSAVHPDTRKVVNDNTRFRVARAHRVKGWKVRRIHQAADGLAGFRGASPHRFHPDTFEPVLLANPAGDTEAGHMGSQQLLHLFSRVRGQVVHHTDYAKVVRVGRCGVNKIGIVETVENMVLD